MNSTILMKCSRYTLAVIGFVVGTEIIYKCIKCLYALIKTDSPNENVYWKVIFFPDDGILSEGINKKPLCNVHEASVEKQEIYPPLLNPLSEKTVHNSSKEITDNFTNHATTSVPNYLSVSSNIVTAPTQQENRCDVIGNFCSSMVKPPMNPGAFIHMENGKLTNSDESICKVLRPMLQKSTSLIHMINVLESARRSLVVCVYLLSCNDLIEAIIRAKVRGVRVRVLLDKGISPMSNISSLLQNGIPIRYSKPPQMMHNKFAIVDAPENFHNSDNNSTTQKIKNEKAKSESAKIIQKSKTGSLIIDSNQCIKSPLNNVKCHCNNNGILMTGSFNWTWSGVVSNHENVIITNNNNLVFTYAKEFEKLWNLFEFVPPENY